MSARDEQIEQRGEAVLLAEHGRGRRGPAGACGIRKFGFEEKSNPAAFATRERGVSSGHASKAEIDDAHAEVPVNQDIARMQVGMDDALMVQVRDGVGDRAGEALQRGQIASGP